MCGIENFVGFLQVIGVIFIYSVATYVFIQSMKARKLNEQLRESNKEILELAKKGTWIISKLNEINETKEMPR